MFFLGGWESGLRYFPTFSKASSNHWGKIWVSMGVSCVFLRSFCGSVGMISFLGETKFSLADRGSAVGIKFVTKIYKLTCNVSEFVKAFINCEWHCDHD